MSDLNFNFGGTSASSGGFQPLPEGTYDAVVYDIDVRETKPKEGVEQKASDGTPARYLNVQYKIMDERENGKYKGRYIWGINSIRFPNDPDNDSEKERQTREIFLGWLNTVTGIDWGGTENEGFSLNGLKGSEVRLVVNHRTYNGEVQDNVKRVLPAEDESNADALNRTML